MIILVLSFLAHDTRKNTSMHEEVSGCLEATKIISREKKGNETNGSMEQ